MNKQEIAAVVALVIILLAWVFVLGPKFIKPSPPPPTTASSSAQPISTETSPVQTTGITATAPTTSPSVESPLPPEQTAHLRNESVDVEFTSYGAGIKSVQLMKYETRNHGTHLPATQEKQNVILNRYGKIPALALENLTGADLGAPFNMTKTSTAVVFERTTPAGLTVRKTFRLGSPNEFGAASDYLIHCQLTIEVAQGESQTLRGVGVTTGVAGPLGPKDSGIYFGVDVFNGQETTHHTLAEVKKTTLLLNEKTQWVAVKNQYFALILIPQEHAIGVSGRASSLDPAEEVPAGAVHEIVSATLTLPPMQLVPGQKVAQELTLYAGPKEYKLLCALGQQQDEILQFGRLFFWHMTWLSAICKLMLLALIFLKSLVRNYGVAIILLTGVIRGLFWPLTGYGTRQMKKMQVLQPQIKVLQAK